MKIKFNEIVEPKDVLSEDLNDVKGGGWWKDLLDSLTLCFSGCSTGQKQPQREVDATSSQRTLEETPA